MAASSQPIGPGEIDNHAHSQRQMHLRLQRPTMLILAYHRVNPEVRDGLSIPPVVFREQLITLLDRGLSNVVLDEAMASPVTSEHRHDFAITFDDGYQDNYLHAAPILDELGLRATVYVVSSMIDSDDPYPWLKPSQSGSYDREDLHMTSSQLEDGMGRGLFTLGSHTVSHPLLSRLDIGSAQDEISLSKSDLERHFGVEVQTFCYPAGDLNSEIVDIVQSAGYRAAVVTPNRYIPETNLTLHRVGIYSHVTPALFNKKTSRWFARAQRSKIFWRMRGRLPRRRSS